jgi:uncharacterized protein YjgD (DUF1641 family)
MAVAVDFRTFQPVDAREDLIRRVQQAPAEHAEAILAAYELLQKLHEKDILNLLIGMLTASDTVINHVVGLISSQEAITALRTVLMLGNLLKNIDADKLHAALNDGSEKPPSLLSLGKQATSKESRRAMATGVALLNLFGDALEKQNSGHKK